MFLFLKTRKIQKKSFRRGFTLIELLITITIFAILTGVVLFNQSKFNSTILLTNLAYDTALTIRQAQTYGINIREFNQGSGASGGKFVPYGVYFDIINAPKSFILFADTKYNIPAPGEDNILNTYGAPEGVGSSINKCVASDRCVNRYNIPRGNYIMDICDEEVTEGVNKCTEGKSKSRLNIIFERPNPDAYIKFDSSVYATGNAMSEGVNIDTTNLPKVTTIILSNSDNTSFRKIRVRSNGLIEIVK